MCGQLFFFFRGPLVAVVASLGLPPKTLSTKSPPVELHDCLYRNSVQAPSSSSPLKHRGNG